LRQFGSVDDDSRVVLCFVWCYPCPVDCDGCLEENETGEGRGEGGSIDSGLDKTVKVLNGRYRGAEGQLMALKVEDFCAEVKILTGPYRGEVVERLPYEDICKVV
jgi:hypothetical protein